MIGAGHLVVIGAKGIARSYGIGEFVIGATVVAIGTSMPELAMTILAKVRGHDEMGLGTILGSNIFNGLLIVAVASIIPYNLFSLSDNRDLGRIYRRWFRRAF